MTGDKLPRPFDVGDKVEVYLKVPIPAAPSGFQLIGFPACTILQIADSNYGWWEVAKQSGEKMAFQDFFVMHEWTEPSEQPSQNVAQSIVMPGPKGTQ